jgi:hypothetical protein
METGGGAVGLLVGLPVGAAVRELEGEALGNRVGAPVGADNRLGAGVTGAGVAGAGVIGAGVTGADVPPIPLTRKVMVVPEALISVMRTPVWPRAPPWYISVFGKGPVVTSTEGTNSDP